MIKSPPTVCTKLCTKFTTLILGYVSRIYPNVTDSCNRCKQSPAEHSHMFGFCPRLATLWSKIFKTISTVYNTTITPEPLLASFCAPLQHITTKAMWTVLAFTLYHPVVQATQTP